MCCGRQFEGKLLRISPFDLEGGTYEIPNVLKEEGGLKADLSKSYEIEFKNGKVFLVFLVDTLEVQYNDYGEIKQLYDINTDEIYD